MGFWPFGEVEGWLMDDELLMLCDGWFVDVGRNELVMMKEG